MENPYFQLLCGEEFFCHALPFDRSSTDALAPAHGRRADRRAFAGEPRLAVKTGAMKPADTPRSSSTPPCSRRTSCSRPTPSSSTGRASGWCGWPEGGGVNLRQSYVRVGKLALIKHQRYAHAKQFKRANKALRRLKTYLGRTMRDIGRKIAGDAGWTRFAWPLSPGRQVLDQRQRQRGRKIYSLHAPEVECIGKGKAHAPYEFGVKVSVATTLKRSKGGQFAAARKSAARQSL